ncbi:MAG TPA: ABC transporter ATP-binding protein [Planctomycetota bacterium]|jgi:ATP-binding cassette subfamily B protein
MIEPKPRRGDGETGGRGDSATADAETRGRGDAGKAPPAVIENPKSKIQNIEPPVIHYKDDREEEEIRVRPISVAMTWRLLTWLKPYRTMYVLGAVIGAAGLGMDLLTPRIQQIIIDEAIPTHDPHNIAYWAAIWGALILGAIALDVFQMGVTNWCGEKVINDLRLAVFDQLQRLSMSFYDKTKLGRIITRGTSDMDSLRGPVISGINTVLFNFILMAGAGAMILWTEWRIFLALVWLAPVLTVCNWIYRQRVGEAYQIMRAGYSKVAANLAENITGVRVVSAFNRQDENLERFNELQDINTENNIRAAHINGIYQPILEFIKFVGQVIILGYGAFLVLSSGPGHLTPGKVVAIFFYWDRFMNPTINMGNFYNSLMQAMASAERLFGLLDLTPEVQDRPNAKPLSRLSGHVVFDHVTYGYDPARPVLFDVNLEIPPGKTFALVGATGSGKSTTVSLLARFYELQQGRILVDGIDIRDATTNSLHKQMGLVLQQNYLFSGTIMENIRYPRPQTTDEEVYAAAKALDVHDMFMSLPRGYETKVGERGGSVSAGLRQLICFTRILVANPSIFLLDEATSSIDTVTELKVQRALERLVKGRTTVIVAHRLSTIVRADCIVVIDQGRIVEKGTHTELIARNGHYAQLYDKFVSHTGSTGGKEPVLKAAEDVRK